MVSPLSARLLISSARASLIEAARDVVVAQNAVQWASRTMVDEELMQAKHAGLETALASLREVVLRQAQESADR